jgi:hypothetical protein
MDLDAEGVALLPGSHALAESATETVQPGDNDDHRRSRG